jgi:hypothetical protein
VSDQAGAQQRRLAAGLHAVGEELASMAKGSATNGAATDLVRQAADRSHALGSWFEDWTRALSWRTSETSHDGGRWHSWCCRRSWPPRRAADPRRQGRREYGQHLGEAARSRTGADDL